MHEDLNEDERETLGDLFCTALQMPPGYPNVFVKVLTDSLHPFERYDCQ